MALRLRCPGCQTPLSCGEEMLGKRLRCVACQKTFVIKGVAPKAARTRRKPMNVWALVGVGVLTAGILAGSVSVAIAWYKTPSGPAKAVVAPPAPAPANQGRPQGYDKLLNQ